MVIESLLCASTPPDLGLSAPRLEPAEVVEHHEVIGLEGLRAGSPELLGYPDVESASRGQELSKHRRHRPPVVMDIGVTGDDQRADRFGRGYNSTTYSGHNTHL
jgi:hypothetical protein